MAWTRHGGGLLDSGRATGATGRWIVIALAGLAGVGDSVADMMPFAMLGDVVDEDELRSGERREGLYAGFFTFLRKLGGASAVFLAGIAERNAEGGGQGAGRRATMES